MTFEEWKVARDDSIKFAQKEIEFMKENIEDTELSKLFGAAYNNAVTDEIRDYNKNIMMTLIEEDLYQIAGALNKIAGELTNAPRVMFKEPEATSRGHWIEHKKAQESEGRLISNFECDKCHVWTETEYAYCPECGAKMYVEVDKVVDDLMKELAHEDE